MEYCCLTCVIIVDKSRNHDAGILIWLNITEYCCLAFVVDCKSCNNSLCILCWLNFTDYCCLACVVAVAVAVAVAVVVDDLNHMIMIWTCCCYWQSRNNAVCHVLVLTKHNRVMIWECVDESPRNDAVCHVLLSLLVKHHIIMIWALQTTQNAHTCPVVHIENHTRGKTNTHHAQN